MTKEYKTIQIRRDTLSDFVSLNPILASGEPAIAIDAKVLKIGDGINRWNNLDSLSTKSLVDAVSGFLSNKISNEIAALVDGAPALLDTLNELAAAINDDENFASTFIASGTQFLNTLDNVSGILQSQLNSNEDYTEYSSGIATFASGQVIVLSQDVFNINSNLEYVSGIADFASGQFPLSLNDLQDVRGPIAFGEQNFYFPYIHQLASGGSLWIPSILETNKIIYSTGVSVDRSITDIIRSVSGIATSSASSGDNISIFNNDSGYIVSDTSEASGSDVISNIISLTQAEYDVITPTSGVVYIITDSSGSGIVGISSLLDDASPQLGGDLDLNNNSIIGTGNLNIDGSGNFANGVYSNGSPLIQSNTSGISGIVNGVNNIVTVDQSTYDNITTKDPNTIYFIIEPEPVASWTPADLGADLALWLDATDTDTITLNGSNVSQWSDKSGNEKHVIQTIATRQPQYLTNNSPTINFDGIDDYLESESLALTVAGDDIPFSVLAVLNYTERGVVQRAINFGSTTDATVFHTVLGLDSTGLYSRQITQRRATDTLQGMTATGSITNTNSIVGNVFTGAEGSLYLDGSLSITGAQNTAAFFPNTFTIGALKRTFISDYSQMAMYEIVLVSSVITITNRQKLEGYLAHKWGLTANLPSDHPYKTVAP